MIRASYTDKSLVVNILTESFDANKSVNYIVQQGSRRKQRLQNLMDYSFEICYRFGDVFMTEDKMGCALIVMPDKKRTSLKSILLDAKLAFNCIGLSNLKKTMARESQIKKQHPTTPMYYLWFIGVDPTVQHMGIGTKLLSEIINEGASKKRPIYLETSTVQNIPWYEKLGFTIYNKLDFGYELFCMKKE